jgi:Xaa-Pro aminopeptidase
MLLPQARTPKSELDRRIHRFKEKLEENGIGAALILQNTDLFYFAGTIQQSHLFIPVDGEPLLMVKKSLERAQAESAIEHIVPLASPKEIPDLLSAHGARMPKVLGMELDVLPANLYLGYRQRFAGVDIQDVSHWIRLCRAVKSDYEIAQIRKAAALADQVAACVPEFLEPGISEIELAGKIEARARKLGHQGVVRMRLWGSEMFYGHLLSGPAAAVKSFLASPTGGMALSPAVAQGPGFKPIAAHEPVLFDYVFAHQGYLADHTRIFSIGELPDDLVRAHQSMLDLQETIKTSARPGVAAGEIYALAVENARCAGYEDNFMGVGPRRIRFVGHGIGLELDEYPFLAQGQEMLLKEQMILAVEPKLIFPGRGVVGIENTHRVTESGLEQLTCHPEGIIIV